MIPTPAQRTAIDSNEPLIIMAAGPGSGKSTTLVSRLKRLATEHDSRRFVCLSFTNAAANVLQERLGETPLGFNGTLHGFALRMLKQHGQHLGYGERLSLIDEDGVAEMVASKAQSLGCKTPLKKLLELKATMEVGAVPTHRPTDQERVILGYYDELREAGMVDFDTLLVEFRRMLTSDVRPHFTDLDHLFVDECQDSAAIDWDIYWALPIANKFFVGDSDQSIYGFRGARPDLMVEASRLRGVQVIKLEDNFRSHREICHVANNLIAHNTDRIPKQTVSTKGVGGEVVILQPAGNEGHEIARVIEACRVVPSGESIAILARTNDTCAQFRKALEAAGIPVAKEARPDLPPDWSIAKAFVEMLANPRNDILTRSYLMRRAVQKWKLTEKEAAARIHGLQLDARQRGVSLAAQTGTGYEVENFNQLAELLAKHEVSGESCMRIAMIIRTLPKGAGLLELALSMAKDEGNPSPATTGIQVRTIHDAKGSEHDWVFVVGCEDEEMPGRRKKDGPAEIEEARRLFFVAITRARKHLMLSSSASRTTSWGTIEPRHPSRFLEELA